MEWSWKLRLFGKMMSFSNIYLYFWLKRKKKVYPVFISGVFICILMDYGFMTNIIDNMLSLCPVSEDTIQELKNV